jgi:S-adenosylmethionine:tRNA ribosyltransferase-isomerase
MITNLHTPQSTLMMHTAAFCGFELLKKAYAEAIKEKYNFFTYGDAMLII